MDENSRVVFVALITLADNLGTLYLGYRMGARIKNGKGPAEPPTDPGESDPPPKAALA